MKQKLLFPEEPTFVDRSTKSVTFQGKLGFPIHRWYRLTPSFSPELALDIADSFKLTQHDFVLDPFSGVGTVPLCMKYRGIPACSVELNPYLQFVGTVKTRNYDDLVETGKIFKKFSTELYQAFRQLPMDAERYLADHQADIPGISNPDRWWSAGNLMQLVCLRRFLRTFDAPASHKELLMMAVLGILIPVSNAKHNHVSLTFADKPLQTVDVGVVLEKKLNEILDDLNAVKDMPRSDVKVYGGNSKFLASVLPESPRPTAVITSPPYPNRFSYARETRPHLFFFDFVPDAKSVGELETEAIGGTWGKATSVLSVGVDPINKVVSDALAPFTEGVPEADNGGLMRSYVIKYFNNLYEHAEAISQVTAKHSQLAYVIGNSKFYDHPLPSDRILSTIFENFGFETTSIDRMRKRQSKSGLYEAVVFMRR